MMMVLLVGTLSGCGWLGGGVVPCTSDDVVVSKSGDAELTCGHVAQAQRYVQVVGGRPIDVATRDGLQRSLVSDFTSDAAGTLSELAKADAKATELLGMTGIEAGKARSRHVYEVLYDGEHLLPKNASSALDRNVAPWASHEADRLVLTEMDIEGWVFYSSLCREVQGGDPLRLSVSNRLAVYNDVKERFPPGPTAEREALVSVGPFWWSVQAAWDAAAYERQQAWIRAAPLPPPMDATSLAYMGSILEGDLPRHARVLHERLGPLGLRE